VGRILKQPLAWNGPLITLVALAAALATGLLLIQLTPLGGVLFVVLVVGGVATGIEPLAGLVAALFLGPLWAYLRAEVPQVPAQIAQVFVGAALLSLWDAVELPVYGVPELIKWVQILLLFLFVSAHLTLRRVQWLLGALLLTGLFQAGVGIWQFGLRGEGPDHFAILGGDFYRAYGTFEQPNPYAGYLGLTASLAVGVVAVMVQSKLVDWYIGRFGRRHPTDHSTNLQIYESTTPQTHEPRSFSLPQLLLTGTAALILLAALGMSWSRGAWLGSGAALAVMTVALPRKVHWGVLLAALLVAGGLGLYVTGLLPSSVVTRLTDFVQDVRFEDVRGVGINDANYAVVERLAHWQAALEMFRYNLWTGVGLGCYEPAYCDFALVNWPIALGHAHNIYLNTAAETGLVGLLAYLSLWGAVLWQTWRASRRAVGLLRGLSIGLLGTWTHLSVHHFLDNLYVNNVHLHIGVLLGLLAFIIQQTDQLTIYDS
jgi:putative inorganic carbon (HCO3(-)) transporter